MPKKYVTVCPGSSDPFYIVTYYIKWVTTSWTHGMLVVKKGKLKWNGHVFRGQGMATTIPQGTVIH